MILSLYSNAQALLGKFRHKLIESAVDPSKDILCWHADIVKEEFGCVLPSESQLLQILTLLETWHAVLHNEQSYAMGFRLGARICDDDNNDGVSNDTVGYVGLAAIDDVVISIFLLKNKSGARITTERTTKSVKKMMDL